MATESVSRLDHLGGAHRYDSRFPKIGVIVLGFLGGAWDFVKGLGSSLWGSVKWLVGLVINAPDFILTVFGIMLPKKMRVQPIILIDENGEPVADRDDVEDAVEVAKDAFDKVMNVRLVIPAGQVTILPEKAPTYALDVDCEGRFLSTFTQVGAWFRRQSTQSLLGILVGYGASITAFAVRNVTGSADGTSGCANWTWTDYVVFESSETWQEQGPRLRLAHEIGHRCNLFKHRNVRGNLMHAESGKRGQGMTNWQKAFFRSSRYVSYRSPF